MTSGLTRRVAFAIALAGLLALPAGVALTTSKVSSLVVVGYAPSDQSLAASALTPTGATVVDRIDALNAFVVNGPLSVLQGLVGTSGIRFVEPVLGATDDAAQWDGAQWDGAQWDGAQWDGATPSAPDPAIALGWQWGLNATDAHDAWPDGGSASACLVDSGVAAHPDLPAPAATYNALDGSTNASDDAGHGTHMAGIVAATPGNSLGVAGVSRASILAAKAFDASGHSTTPALAKGIVWCADHHADVVLLALSVDGSSQLITRALDYADARNAVVVASAGNAGGRAVTFPASYPSVIAVAAVDADRATPSYGSRGPQVALAAPGVSILSTFPGGAYAYGSGTSQAAAFVAGAAADLRAAHPGLAPASVRSALTSSAADIGAPGRDDATGAGLLNVTAALAASWG